MVGVYPIKGDCSRLRAGGRGVLLSKITDKGKWPVNWPTSLGLIRTGGASALLERLSKTLPDDARGIFANLRDTQPGSGQNRVVEFYLVKART